MTETTRLEAAAAMRHASLRWVGPPLLVTGLSMVVWALAGVFAGGSWMTLGLTLFGTGLGLGSFGANNDTALSFAARVAEATGGRGERTGLLSDKLESELADELERDKPGIMGLHPTPRVALGLPVVAVLVQLLALSRLMAF